MPKHKDPEPNPNRMGWGHKDWNLVQNMALEEAEADKLDIMCRADETAGGSAINPAFEQIIRDKFQFDAGWSFYEVEKMVYGEDFMLSQVIGNCVGASHAMLIGTRIAHEILAEGDAEEPLGTGMLGMPWIPYSYGVGRWVGGMLGPGDGSTCSAQIRGTQEHGFIPCYTPGLDALSGTLPQSSAAVNRLLGRSRNEIQKWTPHAKEFDLVDAPRSETADEAVELITKKYIPLQICSGQGFGYHKYDSRTKVHLYRPSGRWAHSMQVMAIFEVKGEWFVNIRNQWGRNAHKGSTEVGMPDGSFCITLEDFDRWIRRSVTLGIGEILGLPSNPGA